MNSMNAIKYLEIENFQSHVKTKIALAPTGQLTVITGQTDSGKTAIFRALRWLLYNTPQGSGFIRAGCSFVRVTAMMESDYTVIREMTPSKNQYRIIAPDAEKPIVLEGFGRSVPMEVQEITGVRPVTIGDTKYNLNMAEQLDGPFLGSSISAPDRAKILGKLAGTEVLDHAGKQAGTDIYRQTQKKDGLEADIEQLTESIATYSYLPALAEKIAWLNAVVTDVKAKQERLVGLKAGLQRLNQININICCCNITIDRWKFVDVAVNITAEVATKVEKAAKLQKHKDMLSALQSGITVAQSTIKRLAPVASAETIVTNVNSQVNLLQQISSVWSRVKLFDMAVGDCKATIGRLSNIEKAEAMIQVMVNAQSNLNQLLDKRAKIQALKLSLDLSIGKIKQFAGINPAESAINSIFEKQKRLSGLQNILNTIKPLITAVEKQKESITLHGERLTQLNAEYQNELNALGVCPLCGTVLGSKAS